MPSSLKTFEDFDHLLADARAEVESMFRAETDDRAIASVKRQLDACTRGHEEGVARVKARKTN
jgi:hypothetical protein